MKILLLTLSLLFVCNFSFGQTKLHPDLTQEEQERIANILLNRYDICKLTNQQVDELINNQVYFNTQNIVIKELPVQEQRTAIRALYAELDEKNFQVFTSIQKEILDERMEQRRNKYQSIKEFEKQNDDEIKSARKVVSKFAKDKIHPLIRKQRVKLDSMMLETDRQKVIAINEAYNQLSLESSNFSVLLIQKIKDSVNVIFNTYPVEEQSKELRRKIYRNVNDKMMWEMEAFHLAQRSRMLEIREEVVILKDSYESEISNLMQEIKPQREQWDTKIRGLFDEVYTNAPLDMNQKEGYYRNWHKDNFDTDSYHVSFLLKSARFYEDHKEEIPTESNTDLAKTSSAFPNPAITTQTLEFIIQQDENVLIEIIDQKGMVIKTILNENRTAGKHQLQVDVSILTSGNYFYRITDGEGVHTVKFMKK